MELRQYYHIIRRWLWLIALCTVLGAVAAFVVSTQTTPVYQASATLLVQQAPSGDGSDYQDILTSERLARTYSEMLKGRPIMENVIRELALSETPGDLAERVSVELVRDTQLIRLKAEHTDPGTAAAVANAVAEAFVSYTETLQQSRYAESMSSLQAQLDELTRLIDETEEKLDGLSPGETAEEARLEGILAGYRNTYSTLVQNYEAMRVSSARSTDNVVLFEEADVPRSPVRPRTLMNTGLAGVVGAMIGVGTAFLIEYLDDSVKSPDDVARVAGVNVVGTIGEHDGEELIAATQPLSPIAEAFRTLRTNIRYSSLDEPLRTILVTSPGPVEGKSTVVANLGVVMAQSDLKVVVVDADLRRPRQHEFFGVGGGPGLTGWLLNGRADRALRRVGQIGELRVLPAGELPPNPAEILGSRRMEETLRRLRDLVDVVIIDSPPVLPVTDAAVLAQDVDGVLLVVDAGETTGEALRQAVEGLRKVEANVIGAVLNRIPARGGGYYYDYYRRYDAYYSENGKEGRRRKKGALNRVREALRIER